MKFFPESFVPDPDKKLNISDKGLINKIVEKLVTDDKDLRLINQTHEERYDKGKYKGGLGDYIVCKFIKKDKNFYILFTKISFYDKKDFDYDVPLMNSFWDCMHNKKLEPHVHEEMPGIQYLPEGNIDTKKLCGIRITLDKKKETSFAVGSVDDIYGSWDGYDKKLSECAFNNLNLYVDWLKKDI